MIPDVSIHGQLSPLLWACGEGNHHGAKGPVRVIDKKEGSRMCPSKMSPVTSSQARSSHLPIMLSMSTVNAGLGTRLNGGTFAYHMPKVLGSIPSAVRKTVNSQMG